MKTPLQVFRLATFWLFLIFVFAGSQVSANNIQITSKPTLMNKGGGSVYVNFKLQWDNSWKVNKPNNWDAAWIFVKYREGGGEWEHMYIDTNKLTHKSLAFEADGTTPAPTTLKVGTSKVNIEGTDYIKGLGAFVYRSSNGKGTIKFDTVKLKWNYADQGVDDNSVVSLRIFAIEMVYVPEEAYYLSGHSSLTSGASYSPLVYSGDSGLITPTNYAVASSGNSDFSKAASYFASKSVPNAASAMPKGWNPPGKECFTNPGPGSWGVFNRTMTNFNRRANNNNGVTSYAGVAWTVPEQASIGGSGVLVNLYHYGWSNAWANNNGAWTYSHWAPALKCMSGNQSGTNSEWTFWGYNYSNGWNYSLANDFYLEMPQPYRPTGFFLEMQDRPNGVGTTWSSVSNFTVWGSNNVTASSATWTQIMNTLTGARPCTLEGDNSQAAAARNSYKYYKFTINVWGWTMMPRFGLRDETPGGDPANAWYYDPEKITDKVGIKNMHNLVDGKNNLTYSTDAWLSKGTTYSADSNYPNGYNAFYIMKHELSQHAYVDFLNNLTKSQQEKRCGSASLTTLSSRFYNSGSHRNWVRVKEIGIASPAIFGCWVDGESANPWKAEYNAGNVAMNYLSWMDNSAYLCWSGLRPLTELEYEKSCRGTAVPVLDEFAWGTSGRVINTGAPFNIDKANETANPANSNFAAQVAHATPYFPMRVGSFATATSTRQDAGASFYGVLNLSDNVSEIYINISTPQGVKFNGEHGSGKLDGKGDAQVNTWPLSVTPTTTGVAIGTGIRGVYANNLQSAMVSNRTYIITAITTNDQWIGCRGGRTAPKN